MNLIHFLIYLYIWVLIISALLSWFPTSNSNSGLATVKHTLAIITEPVLRPLRQILPRPRLGGVGIDFSVLVAIIVLTVINRII